jgi:hypothetical protein
MRDDKINVEHQHATHQLIESIAFYIHEWSHSDKYNHHSTCKDIERVFDQTFRENEDTYNLFKYTPYTTALGDIIDYYYFSHRVLINHTEYKL